MPSACVVCRAGTFNDQTGQASCVPCTVGTYNPSTGSSVPCAACPVGTYADSPGQASCRLGCEVNADVGSGCGDDVGPATVTAAAFGGLIPENVYGMEPVRCGYSNATVAPDSSDFDFYSAFSRGLVSSPGVFYNGYGGPAGISGSTFHLLSAYVTPWKDGVVTIIGYRDGLLVARYTSPVLKHDPASPVNLNFGTTLYNIDNMEISGDGSNFVLAGIGDFFPGLGIPTVVC
jgi:hypothetical protein